MTQLTLNEEETGVLADTLEGVLSDLGFEIADTDRMAFREELKKKREILERVLASIRDSAGISEPGSR